MLDEKNDDLTSQHEIMIAGIEFLMTSLRRMK